uniref:Ribosomal protein L5 n=1 Tax=Melosira undulata TaxID=2133757 RepID=A0A3G1PWE6_9STRA|nr:ribosomal protein L5 [Melosira undulata]AVR57565.1 ribosomal protein L5 [Melosira undulata]
MQNLNQYYQSIIQYDLINKFFYTNSFGFSKISGVILIFLITFQNIKQLINMLCVLELICFQKVKIKLYNKYNSKVKIKKGTIIGCQVNLNLLNKNIFLLNLIHTNTLITVLLNNYYNKLNYYNLLLKLDLNFFFKNFYSNYFFFKNLPKLTVNVIIKTNNVFELFFLLQAYKFKLKIK